MEIETARLTLVTIPRWTGLEMARRAVITSPLPQMTGSSGTPLALPPGFVRAWTQPVFMAPQR
jgi:hypothetical protein